MQGASDAGLIPMVFPDYKSVEAHHPRQPTRRSGERRWIAKRGLTVVEIMDAIHADDIRAMYILGENPAMSDPDQRARARGAGQAGAPRRAGHLPDGDGLARRCYAAGRGACGKDGAPTRTRTARCRWRAAVVMPGHARPDWCWLRRKSRTARRAATGLTSPERGLRGDGGHDAISQQHHLGTGRSRKLRDLSMRCTGCCWQRDYLWRAASRQRAGARGSYRPSCHAAR